MEIRLSFEVNHGRYGSVKVHREVAMRGFLCGRNRVARRMKALGLRSKTRRKFRVTTESKHSYPISPNLLKRNFATEAPNRVWASDITYIWAQRGCLYLRVFIDLFSQRVVGWSLKNSLDATLVIAALQRAVRAQRPRLGLMIHSNRGDQYAHTAFREVLAANKCIQNMSRKRNCWDNAISESFFRALKTELVYHIDLLASDHAQ